MDAQLSSYSSFVIETEVATGHDDEVSLDADMSSA